MKYHRDRDGVIVFNEYMPRKGFLELDSKRYYYKETSITEMFNELISSIIAEQYGIDHINYINVINDGFLGVIGRDFKEGYEYLSMDTILGEYFGDDYEENYRKYNNLKDVIASTNSRYGFDLSDDIIKLFLFDALIANSDRHPSNYGVLKNEEGVKLAPVFDNELMLSEDGIDSLYSLKVNRDDRYPGWWDIDSNYLYKFFLDYDSYKDFFLSKLPIISDSNVSRIIEQVEDESKTKIPSAIKEKIEKGFVRNNKMIDKVMIKKR